MAGIGWVQNVMVLHVAVCAASVRYSFSIAWFAVRHCVLLFVVRYICIIVAVIVHMFIMLPAAAQVVQ